MNNYGFIEGSPGASGLIVIIIVVVILIKENQGLKRRVNRLAGKNAELYALILSERSSRQTYHVPPDEGFPDETHRIMILERAWACAILDLDPETPEFSEDQVREARRKTLKRVHPDAGGTGRVGQVHEAVSILERLNR